MNMKDLLKDKNKLLMIIPILLGILFIYVFFLHGSGQETQESSDNRTAETLLEPESRVAEKAANKMEAYKQDEREKQEQARLQEASRVRGSDFYFEMQNREEKYDEATLERIRRMHKDPYSEVMEGYGGGKDGRFSRQLEAQLNGLEDEEALNEIIRKAKKNARIRKDLAESSAYREKMYERISGYDKEEQASASQPVSSDTMNNRVQHAPIYLAGNGKRMRRQRSALPKSSNLIKACIHGDQTIVTGSTVRMRLLEDVHVSGMKIPANTLFYGTATLGASRLDIVINNLKVGNSINPVSFLVFDNDAMEGLNLPNNMKATAAKRMEQGLVQNIDMPLSSIGTMTSEVTSAINATTQIAKQILNMSLSQTKVHLKSNYIMYIQEESEESKLKREAVQQELQKLYSQLEQEKEKKKSHPLKTLIDKL